MPAGRERETDAETRYLGAGEKERGRAGHRARPLIHRERVTPPQAKLISIASFKIDACQHSPLNCRTNNTEHTVKYYFS